MKYILGLLLVLCTTLAAHARNPLDFTLLKLGNDPAGPTLLVIGGIQGDEPGGFNAAGVLASHYAITKGNVWVVPNLNFPSIINRSRGLHGDMNRKFARLGKEDPEYNTVEKIKSIILHPQVDLILNLHDGSGFYRPKWENSVRNPDRWGQSVIIDQESLEDSRFGNLAAMATVAVADANNALLVPEHLYHLKNTRTRDGDVEMEKTLTYFAINHGKPAFGVEASKSFNTATRAYYHVRILESFMRQAGIRFERDFTLTPEGLEAAMNRNLHLAFHDGRLKLDMDNIRSTLRYMPLSRNAGNDFIPSKPLLTVVDEGNGYRVYYGNNRITQLMPQYFDYDDSLKTLRLMVDGKQTAAPIGSMVQVGEAFEVTPEEGYRVNVIGFTRSGVENECGISISKNDIMDAYSIDKAGTVYRVEVYRENKFSGMVLVRFGDANVHLVQNNAPPSEDTMGR
ncbi:succinylglutamate desuccinylase/aspartoacylase family protein [Desulfovibrio mangrovi]|uniref:M14 family metallopeptidase n=1 Tax=Desulfovibrio mangrovi TaxID=2976983 RepID=UPI002247BE3F|nr:M14 family metallopeptidase [Desulfovibrio mangrovi]UZP66603.1 succinylglutamate desuccinylase/aspartoacylase family protein [Desulfovibrio mangrovi]